MNKHPWFIQHKNILRVAVLLVFVVSFLGPWVFDLINVPAQYPCHAPNIRLEGDFCGLPLSGYFVFFLIMEGVYWIISALASGTFSGNIQEFIIGLYLLPLVPFFTTLFFIWKRESPRLRTINLVAWALALLHTLFIYNNSLIQNGRLVLHLWGLGLYIVAAISAVVLEIILSTRKTDDEQTSASLV